VLADTVRSIPVRADTMVPIKKATAPRDKVVSCPSGKSLVSPNKEARRHSEPRSKSGRICGAAAPDGSRQELRSFFFFVQSYSHLTTEIMAAYTPANPVHSLDHWCGNGAWIYLLLFIQRGVHRLWPVWQERKHPKAWISSFDIAVRTNEDISSQLGRSCRPEHLFRM